MVLLGCFITHTNFCASANDGLILVVVKPKLAEINLAISAAVERNAPAPASVGKSQLEVWSPSSLYPTAKLAFILGVKVIAVSFILSGFKIRVSTRFSYVVF